MPFSELRRRAVATEDADVNSDDLRVIPPEFMLPSAPGPGDREYIHSVFYDTRRFETFPDPLLQQVRDEFPEQPLWQPEPVHAASLHGRMAAYGPSHIEKFLQFGYVAELEPPVYRSGRFPKRSPRSQMAWNAFRVNASFAEAIADAIRECRDHYKLDWVFHHPHITALAPIVGRVDDSFRKKDPDEIAPEPGTTILCRQGTLLVAPRAILRTRRNGRPPVIAYPADPVTLNTASTTGRAQYSNWTRDGRKDILNRVQQEIHAWCAAGFNPEAFLLWILQTVAVLRIQATDCKGRERPSYVRGDVHAKREDDQAEFRLKLGESGLEKGDACPIEMRRAPVTAQADVISMLAGGIGLEDEAIWRDNDVLRDNLARQDLGSLAGWIGRLKRFHRETFSPWHARLIEEILTDTPNILQELEMTRDDWSGPRLVRAQFPDDVWQGLVDTALYGERGETDVEVSYNWNGDPIQQATILSLEGDGNDARIVISGPLLDLSAPRRAWWREQLEQFRQSGSLTI
ncbi:hypothetical protein [Bradyrhizobium sp. B120]|uniref:hypothetical protein n=1 Tax=Bradyrhizobium sp. B120 TaxID=3410088 RepID=UPI003B98316E